MKTYYTTSETAEIFGVTTKTIHNWDKDDSFVPDQRIGDQRFYSEEQIELKLGKSIKEAKDPILALTKEDIDSLLWLGKEYGEKMTLMDFSEGQTLREKFQCLYIKIIEKSTAIFRRNGINGANFLLTSPEMCSWFEIATAGFCPEAFKEEKCQIKLSGTVNNRWKLYSTPLLQPGQILMGVKINNEIIKSADSIVCLDVNDWALTL